MHLHDIAEELKNIREILERQQSIEVEEDCSDYYKGYCARYEDGCFHQCKDCISREWLVNNAEFISQYDKNMWVVPLSKLADAPSVVPSRAEGEWVDDPKNNAIKYCSNCELAYTKDFLLGMLPYDNPNPQMVEPPYCPNCGAKMKGADTNCTE